MGDWAKIRLVEVSYESIGMACARVCGRGTRLRGRDFTQMVPTSCWQTRLILQTAAKNTEATQDPLLNDRCSPYGCNPALFARTLWAKNRDSNSSPYLLDARSLHLLNDSVADFTRFGRDKDRGYRIGSRPQRRSTEKEDLARRSMW